MELLRSFLGRHFPWKPLVALLNVGCFLRLKIAQFLWNLSKPMFPSDPQSNLHFLSPHNYINRPGEGVFCTQANVPQFKTKYGSSRTKIIYSVKVPIMPCKIDVATTLNVTIAFRRHFQSQPAQWKLSRHNSDNLVLEWWQAISC